MMNQPEHRFQPIAIVGRGCCLPNASSLEEYWQIIKEDRSTAATLPKERFCSDLFYDPEVGKTNRSYTNLGCLTKSAQALESLEIPVKWRNHPETVYKRLASVAVQAFHDAGRGIEDWGGMRGGVFVGHTRAGSLSGDLTYSTYVAQVAELLSNLSNPTAQRYSDRLRKWSDSLIQNVRSEMPTRAKKGDPPLGAAIAARAVAETLSWDGPQMTLNGACASSLQALHAAVRSLQMNRCDVAIAAGASYCHSDTLVLFSQARSLSKTGSRPFEQSADGLVVGEGFVVLVLKRLNDAIAQKDKIFGVVRGVSVASDGRGKSLWAPKMEGQIAAIHRAYPSTDAIRKIQFVEAHATSTQIGDACEVAALAKAYAPYLATGQRIPIGGVKANIGHTLETAGLAGMLKVLLCMEKEWIPAHTHITELNKNIPWDTIPLWIPNEPSHWACNSEGERWAAINSFGIGGLNSHVVVEQFATKNNKQKTAPNSAASVSPTSRKASLKSTDRIAIVGLGCVVPGANAFEEFKESATAGTSAISDLPNGRWVAGPDRAGVIYQPIPAIRGGFINHFAYDWRRHKVPPKQVASGNPLQFMILEAVDQAIAGLQLLDHPARRERTGVVVGTLFGGEFSNQLQMGLRIPDLLSRIRKLLQADGISSQDIEDIESAFSKSVLERMPALQDETGSFTSSSLASRITKSFDLMGGAVAVDSGHASSGAALHYCMDQLLSGDNDFMICVGAQQDLSPARFDAWASAGWLGDGTGTDVLHEKASGVQPGEGCGVMLLQRVNVSLPPVRKPYGYLRGLGIAYDRWGDLSYQRSSARAIQDTSKLGPENINGVRFSPMGNSSVDTPCVQGIAATLGAGNRPLDSVVSMLGHSGAASGIIECMALFAKDHRLTGVRQRASQRLANHLQDYQWAFQTGQAAAEENVELICMGSPWEPIYSFLIERTNNNHD